MKKIIFGLLVILAVFSLIGCEKSLHNGTYVYISGVEVSNVPSAGYGPTAYFLDAWIPGNQWGDTTPNQAAIVNGTASVTFSDAFKFEDPEVSMQIVAPTVGGGFWEDSTKLQSGSAKAANPYTAQNYTLVWDCAAKTLSLRAD